MRTYRLRIRNAANTSWEHTFTNFVRPPIAGGQRVYPLEGKTTSKPWVCELEADATLVAALADADDRYGWSSRIADVSYNDDGAGYVVKATGRVAEVQIGGSVNAAVARVELHDERLVERSSEIFPFSNTTTIWPPGTTRQTGFFAHAAQLRIQARAVARAHPITAVRFDTFGTSIWPQSVQAAINDDVRPGLTKMTSTRALDYDRGSFFALRLNIGANELDGEPGVDYPVLGFAYEFSQLINPSVFNVGNNPAHDDNPIGCFVYDPSNALSGLDGDLAFLYFGATDDDDGNVGGFAPTEDVPLHLKGNVWAILADIYDGVYGGEVVKYDSAQMTAIQSDPRFPVSVEYRITDGPVNMATWVQENIYKPFMCVPLVNADGEVKPTPLILTDADDIADVDTLTLLDGSNCHSEPRPSFEYRSGEQITRVTYHPASRQRTAGLLSGNNEIASSYDKPLDRFEPVGNPYSFDQRVEEYGVHVLEVELPGIHTPADSPGPHGTYEFAEVFSRNWLDRFSDGPVYYEVPLKPEVTEVQGDWVALDCEALQIPNAVTGARSGKRVVQIVDLDPESQTGPLALCLDGGPYLQPLATPTISASVSTDEPKHRIQLTTSNLPAGATAQIQACKKDTEPSAGEWWDLAATTETTIDVGNLPAATKVYFRCRAVQEHRLSSSWSTSTNATTNALTAPSSVTATASGTEVALTWTNGEDDEEVEVWYSTSASFSEATATRFETFQAGTTGCTVGGLNTSTLYYFYIRHVDEYGGYSATASDSATTEGTTTTLVTTGGEVHIELGANIGTRTAP